MRLFVNLSCMNIATDILEIDNDINILENYQEEIFKDDPFYTLKSEDEDD